MSRFSKKRKHFKNQKIKAVIAVDAISFNKMLKVNKNGFVSGMIKDETISRLELMKLEKEFSAFEEFVSIRKNLLISDAFVFQVQPIKAKYSSFVIHISPSSQGKGTDREVKLLLELKQKLESQNFIISSYAYDGDKCYKGLHDNLFNSYESLIKNDLSFINFSTIEPPYSISDPLHLLKRGRYRLISRSIHAGITKYSPLIEIDDIKSILNLPSITYSNNKITKMHDDLAINLFSFTSLNALINSNKKIYLSYFLPLCLLNIALSEKGLIDIERINLLETSFYYFFLLKEEGIIEIDLLPQKKSKFNKDLRLFDNVFFVEITNTIYSILSIIYSTKGIINLNRLSSNPLEHTFGLIRMKSKYQHTFQKGLEAIGKVQLLKKISKIVGNGNVIGRKSYYGQIIFNNFSSFKYSLNLEPRDLAVCLHLFFGLPVKYGDIACSDMQDLLFVSNEVVDAFFKILDQKMFPHFLYKT